MEKFLKISIIFLLACFLSVQASFSEEKLRDDSPFASLSQEEIAQRIKYMLEVTPESASFIPELKITHDDEGNILDVMYNMNGTFENIEKLDKDILVRLHNRVNNERVRIQNERIQRQLEAIRAAQNIPTPPPPAHTPPFVPRPPHTLPSVPKPPPPVPKAPYLPPAPPTAPRK